jgi:CobQ-like glutamine amidotransferase family enzyme
VIMKLTLVHLYGDVMNTYGDWGNLVCLRYRAAQRGIETRVKLISLGDDLRSDEADIIFFGGGQDASQDVVAADLPRITPTLKQEVKQGVALLAICGGYQLLGSQYITSAGQYLPGAGILPVPTKAGPGRMMHNVVVAINPQLTIPRQPVATLVGFENHSGATILEPGAMALGRVLKGSGNNGSDGTEGVVYNHAVGTYLHGSCLPKNPHLADWLLLSALQRRYAIESLPPLDDADEWQAHRLAVGLKA